PSFGSFRKETGSWEGLYTGLNSETDGPNENIRHIEFESEEVTGNLFGAARTGEAGSSTFQLNKKYIVSTLKTCMLVIDQHRAHTWILYDELLRSIIVSAALSQQLLFTLHLKFRQNKRELLKGIKEALELTWFIFGDIVQEPV